MCSIYRVELLTQFVVAAVCFQVGMYLWLREPSGSPNRLDHLLKFKFCEFKFCEIVNNILWGHILWLTFCSSHFVAHILWLTFCGSHLVDVLLTFCESFVYVTFLNSYLKR